MLALAATTSAQPVGPDSLDCARQDAVQRQMEAAKQKGQMLRRQRLETELATLNTRCGKESKSFTRLDQIGQQQQLVRELELELQEARDILRALTAQRP
ncbi:DUF1090 family protein [Variovorax sp. PAMC 28711]|uniref:DUF1090 family protein n=1 Tax=Variovorax sp. PAMC 28711 TaxID=1795631 RepID=UPI00078C3683|nr:DUF1090 family protein [Variovorax sp. PAMC 28711]AMM24412.1 hypothetical protein AX767_08645 [Variovorax sp. PAMC 28711]